MHTAQFELLDARRVNINSKIIKDISPIRMENLTYLLL